MEYDVVFEGGGAKGIAFLGACEELFARGHTIARIVGTSAGAIFASLIAAGYDAAAARAAVARRDENGTLLLARLLDPPVELGPEILDDGELVRMLDAVDIPLVSESTERRVNRTLIRSLTRVPQLRQLLLFLEKGGFYEGDVFVRWLGGLLEERCPGLGSATFAQLHGTTGRDFSLVASDLDDRRMLVFNHRTTPDLPVVLGVRMSMGIPGVWKEVLWQPGWGRYLGRDLSGHVIVDGGLLSNFPMHLIATDMAEVVEVMGPEDPRRVPNLGFLIDEELDDPAFTQAPPEQLSALAPVQRRLARLIRTALEARDRYVVERCMANHEVCRLPARGYGTTEFDMSQPRFDALVDAGRRAAAAWFDHAEQRHHPPQPG